MSNETTRKIAVLTSVVAAATLFISSTATAADEGTKDSPSRSDNAAKAPDETENTIASPKMMLLYLEMITSGRTFPNDSVNVRLERLEGIVFGKEQQGDPKQRLAALMTKVSSGASDVSGGTRRLIGGVSKSDVAAPGHNPTDPQNGRGSVKFAASHIKGNRSLEVVFSIGGSRFENSFNGQGQMDALVAQYVKYVAGLLVNPPAGDQLRVNLTMSGPGISGGFSEGSVTARPAPRMVAMPATAMIQSSPPGAAAYGRIATAGFTRTWSGSGTIGAAGFARPSSSSSGSIKTASFSLPSSGGGSTGTASFLQPSPGNGTGGQHLRGGDSSPNDSSPVHFSPLIIQVNAGGSHVSNSFNSESQSTNFLEKAQTGNLDAVPSARPYALSVSIGGSSVSESFDGAGAEQPVRTAIEAFVASKNFETPSDSMPMKRQRPLILNISMGGGRFENSFNKTGGIVRLANKLADGLESSVRPEVLNNLSEIYLGKGGCHITDAYSSK